jgi:ParB-like chromosome segregation protein Spo0J
VITDDQPVSHVLWVPRESLRGNDYNPNRVAPPELKLLKLSIVEDGWTQPIVRRPDDEIVDGYHRWLTAEDPHVAALTDGMVPVVTINPDAAHQRLSTIRHNRARGTHHVLRMADIVNELANELDMPVDEVRVRLGMDKEEVTRLLERGSMIARASSENGEFGEAWRSAPK